MREKYIIFKLGMETYAVNILDIIIIEEAQTITRVHGAPEYVAGIVNLRGEIVSVVDTAAVFGIPNTELHRFLIAEIQGMKMAFAVTDVEQIYSPDEEGLLPVPELAITPDTAYAAGIIKMEDKIIIVVSPDKILNAMKLGEVENILQGMKE